MPVTINGTTGASLVDSGALPFLVGQVCFFAMDTAPDGFVKCNGSAISRTTYSALFDAIGTIFGSGDGSTTFELPDLRGEFPRGWDDGRGVDSGRSFGAAQLDQMQRITGSFTAAGVADASMLQIAEGSFTLANNTNTRPSGTDAGFARFRIANFDSADSPDARASATTGGETRSRNVALLACIKF